MRSTLSIAVCGGALSLIALTTRALEAPIPGIDSWTTRAGVTTRAGELAPLPEHTYFDVHGSTLEPQGYVPAKWTHDPAPSVEVRRGDYVEPESVR